MIFLKYENNIVIRTNETYKDCKDLCRIVIGYNFDSLHDYCYICAQIGINCMGRFIEYGESVKIDGYTGENDESVELFADFMINNINNGKYHDWCRQLTDYYENKNKIKPIIIKLNSKIIKKSNLRRKKRKIVKISQISFNEIDILTIDEIDKIIKNTIF
jgi:hypothetical protein